MIARVSNKGQITIAAAARQKLGIKPNSEVEVIVKENEITIRPLKSALDVAGSLSRYAKNGEGLSWPEMRERAERAAAEEVMRAHARSLRGRR
jgi:AbrB family looped-hinge helix DNA binding protein